MERIATTGLKIDLHIHSHASSRKDGKKVKNNTLENLPVLVQRLNDQGVQICAITDHDAFSYALYQGLKAAESQKVSIKKVLPGIEFTVDFIVEGSAKALHIVAIFSDADDGKVRNIETIMNSHPLEIDGAYSEEQFLQILREIDIDTILIAHQKNTISSKKPRENDATSLGMPKFLEFVYSDYFEAFEFKNKKNEVFNKAYLLQEQLEEQVRFVTGTDCHDWSLYPKEDKSDQLTGDFPYTYVKCLPTFRGLVMAMTDSSRMRRGNSFFGVDNHTLSEIVITSNGSKISVPLSPGINAIIGDNSVGKSLLLHALTGYSKATQKIGAKLPPAVKRGYKNYLQEHNIKIVQQIPSDALLCFDMQGEVRSKFEEHTIDCSAFLGDHFPEKVNAKRYKDLVLAELERLISYLGKRFALEARMNALPRIQIEVAEQQLESLTFEKNIRKAKVLVKPHTDVVDCAEEVKATVAKLLDLKVDAEDRTVIKHFIQFIDALGQKHQKRKKEAQSVNHRLERIASVIDTIDEEHNRTISEDQKRHAQFSEATTTVIESFVSLISEYRMLTPYAPIIPHTKVETNHNTVNSYEFITKLKVAEIGPEYFLELIKKPLRVDAVVDWSTITESELASAIKYFDSETNALDYFKAKVLEFIDQDFEPSCSIIVQGSDRYQEMSAGFDAKVYFDLLSWERNRPGIYVIDQPEDNISQKAIREYLLDRFKAMGAIRQVIMVTHNPQFIVNLDVDNLIYLSMVDNQLCVQSGALEYADEDTDILKIVADTIDGGLESIRKRWKRYDKASDL